MVLSGYRYAGDHLAQALSNWDVQHQDMGILELNIDRLVPGGKEPLILSLQEFTIPQRSVGKATLEYLNGNVQYPTRPEPLDDISVTFRDFPQIGTRAILKRWFQAVYDEVTGLMLPPGLLKTTGFLVLFQTDGQSQRTALLEGLWPSSEPEVAVAYANGESMPMQINLVCDRIIWDTSLFNPASGAVSGAVNAAAGAAVGVATNAVGGLL